MTSAASGVRRVLVVDDDVSSRAGLCRILQSSAVAVETAATLEEAESILKNGPIDIVVSDVFLSGAADGLELAAWAGLHCPATAVLLITAFGDPEIRDEALRRGARDYWEKQRPFEELLDKIRALGIPVTRAPPRGALR